MPTLHIALLQLLPGTDPEASLQKGLAACREAKRLGADIALFPELWNTGYHIPQQPAALHAAALPAEGTFTAAFAACARELDMAIGVTLLETYDPAPRNTLCLLDRHGREVLRYAKVHTCAFGDERVLTPGEEFRVITLDTAAGPVRVGAMICYDREFPESVRLLMLDGAELILVPNACPMEQNRLAQLRARAFENMLAIATCNYPAPHPDCNGHSTLFDGVAYLPDLPGSRDTCVLEAGEGEGVYLAALDLDMLRDYRAREVHGNAYRRPRLYGNLTDRAVRPPFVRPNRCD